jgi:hypothetical protein
MSRGGKREGAGRKQLAQRRVALLARVEPETRRLLEQEAKRKNHSLSDEVAFRLKDSLDFPRRMRANFGNDEGLARLVASAATIIDLTTGRRWEDDAFTGRALLACVNFIIQEKIGDGPLVTPDETKRRADAFARAAKISAEQYEFECSPEGVGLSVGRGLSYQIESSQQLLDQALPPNVKIADSVRLNARTRKLLKRKKS